MSRHSAAPSTVPDTRTTPRRWRSWGAARRFAWPYALVAPVVLLILVFTYFPIAQGVGLSLTDTNLLRLHLGVHQVGLDNYAQALGSSRFWSIAFQTFAWTAVTVAGSLILGVTAAVLLTEVRRGEPLRGRAILAGLLLVPFVVPPVVAGYVWNYLYSGSGPLNGVLAALGQQEPFYFLSNMSAQALGLLAPMWSLMQVGIWVGFPFFFLMTAAALTSVPVELLEAAELDGAGSWTTFRKITLPLIAPVLEVTIFLEILFRLGSPDLPYLLTGGGPLDASNVWSVFIYQIGFAKFDIGYGSALGIVLFLVTMPFAILYVRRARRQITTA
jgi:multiple sugar transport system permease protein